MNAIQLAQKLGSLLKKRRLSMDLSKIELADKSGISAITIRRIEKGDCVGIGLDNLLSVATVLELRMSQIFHEIEEDASFEEENPSHWKEIMLRIEHLSAKQKNGVARILQEVLSTPL